MDLKEFIKTAITDITDAVRELQSELDNGAIVSPSLPNEIQSKTIDLGGTNRLVSTVDFDVALTVGSTDTVSGNAKAGIQILSAKMSGDSKSHAENVSRLTFSVPVIYPSQTEKTDMELALEKQRGYMRKIKQSNRPGRSPDRE